MKKHTSKAALRNASSTPRFDSTADVESPTASSHSANPSDFSSSRSYSSPQTVWSRASDKTKRAIRGQQLDVRSEEEFPSLSASQIRQSPNSLDSPSSVTTPHDLSEFPPLPISKPVAKKVVSKTERILAAESAAQTQLDKVTAEAQEGFTTVRTKKGKKLEEARIEALEKAAAIGRGLRKKIADSGGSLPGQGKSARKNQEAEVNRAFREQKKNYRGII